MRHSIATVSLSGTLQEKLEAAAAARFDAVEIFENDLLFFDGTAREVRQSAADLGLDICLFQPFRDFEGVPDDVFARNIERAERKFDLMQELGAPLLLVCSTVAKTTLDDDARAAAQLHALADEPAGAAFGSAMRRSPGGRASTPSPVPGAWSRRRPIRIWG